MVFLHSGWAVVLANILVPLGILVFSSGFFPYKPLLPGLATFDEIDQNATPAIFDKVIFMVVDALRRYEIKSNRTRPAFILRHPPNIQLKPSLAILSIPMNLVSHSRKGLLYFLLFDNITKTL
jgi:hypothetical protein